LINLIVLSQSVDFELMVIVRVSDCQGIQGCAGIAQVAPGPNPRLILILVHVPVSAGSIDLVGTGIFPVADGDGV
jgi:hypothetical protein